MGALSDGASVTRAAEVAHIPHRSVYDWREADPAFAADWDAAIEAGTDRLEDEALRRAKDGTVKPVFYLGSECGHVREYSDTLTIFLLKARRPAKYRERSNVVVSGDPEKPLKIDDARADNLSLVADLRRRLAGGDAGEPAAGDGGAAARETQPG